MTAEIFLTCFLACTFSFIVFGLLGWQVGAFFLKRAIKRHLPEILNNTLNGLPPLQDRDPEAAAQFQELIANAALTPPGITPHLAVVKCQCGREQAVPLEQSLPAVLHPLGWRVHEMFDGWGCPSCVSAALERRAAQR